MINKRLSPMKPEFWTKRINPDTNILYTKEEAILHIKSFRKCNILFWTKRINPDTNILYTKEEANIEVMKFQHIGLDKSRFNKKPHRYNTKIEYYLNKGYSKEESEKMLLARQTTFSKEKLIKKYGEEEGLIRWQKRQDNWQKSLKNKSVEEISIFNKKKHPINRLYQILKNV